MRTKIFKRRNAPVNKFYGGSAWFSITSECMKWMLDYVDDHDEYIKYYVHGLCMDEMFFQTLAEKSPYAKNIVNNNLRFMIWDGSNTGGPQELKSENICQIMETDCIFARKFTNMDVINDVCVKLKEYR